MAHHSKITCPHCGRELTVRSAGKMRRHFDRDTVQVIEKISDTGIVIRIVKIWFDYNRDSLIPKESIYENDRIFVRYGPDGRVAEEPYYFSYSKGTLKHWMPGERPIFFKYTYNFGADICGHVYRWNLPEALSRTP